MNSWTKALQEKPKNGCPEKAPERKSDGVATIGNGELTVDTDVLVRSAGCYQTGKAKNPNVGLRVQFDGALDIVKDAIIPYWVADDKAPNGGTMVYLKGDVAITPALSTIYFGVHPVDPTKLDRVTEEDYQEWLKATDAEEVTDNGFAAAAGA